MTSLDVSVNSPQSEYNWIGSNLKREIGSNRPDGESKVFRRTEIFDGKGGKIRFGSIDGRTGRPGDPYCCNMAQENDLFVICLH